MAPKNSAEKEKCQCGDSRAALRGVRLLDPQEAAAEIEDASGFVGEKLERIW